MALLLCVQIIFVLLWCLLGVYISVRFLVAGLQRRGHNVRLLIWRVAMMKQWLVLGFVVLLGACSAEVGSKKWCDNMEDKPEGDWTLTEAKDYAKHCLLK